MTTGAARAVFVDTNVLVYANAAQAPLHRSALETLRFLQEQGHELWISRQVLREYLATRSRVQSFAGAEAAALLAVRIEQFQHYFRIAEDGPEVTRQLLSLMIEIPIGGKQIHDANIVATMLTHGIPRLLTHNTADFARFSQVVIVAPLTLEAS